MKRTAVAVLITAAVLGGAAPAHADVAEPDVAPQIAQALEIVPGGVVIDYWTAEWAGQGMRLEVPYPNESARSSLGVLSVGNCATGRICAYSATGLGGSQLSWGVCGTYSTAALGGPARSIANARSSGTMYAHYGSATVGFAVAGTWANVSRTATSVSC